MENNAPFLGKGWSFPPCFTDGGGDLDMVQGADDISQSLQILLSTRMNERVMLGEFGCDLTHYQFEEIDQALVNNLSGLISNAIIAHEPRIKLQAVDISDSQAEHGLLLIRIDYTVRATNSRYNMVYPFYLHEALTPGV